MDVLVGIFGVLGGLAAIVQTIVTFVERAERRRERRQGAGLPQRPAVRTPIQRLHHITERDKPPATERARASAPRDSGTTPGGPRGPDPDSLSHDWTSASAIQQPLPGLPLAKPPSMLPERLPWGVHSSGRSHELPSSSGTAVATWRACLAYLLGVVGSLIFWRDQRASVRFHSVQSLWIDILAIAYFVLALIVALIYSGIRFSEGEEIPSSDPVMWGWVATSTQDNGCE
jgi:hypothetical protein